MRIVPRSKIVQFQAMPNDEFWQGEILVLCEDGVLYLSDYVDGKTVLKPHLSCKDIQPPTGVSNE